MRHEVKAVLLCPTCPYNDEEGNSRRLLCPVCGRNLKLFDRYQTEVKTCKVKPAFLQDYFLLWMKNHLVQGSGSEKQPRSIFYLNPSVSSQVFGGGLHL